MKEEIHVVVTGMVQGVGFRSTVQKRAMEHRLTGYVRNLEDGSVEICAQGSKDRLESFLRELESKPILGRIERLETTWRKVERSFPSFEIIR